jgi:DNA-binding winged helix-turn-helix (wHTH) protein
MPWLFHKHFLTNLDNAAILLKWVGLGVMRYRFGPFVADSSSRHVSRADESQFSLHGKQAELLLYLIEHRNGVVTRHELLGALWKAHTTPASLDTAIARLRHALGDIASRPKYIQNAWGEGYRFVADVEESGHAQAPEELVIAAVPLPANGHQKAASVPRRPAFLRLAACFVLVGGIAGVAYWALKPHGLPELLKVEGNYLVAMNGRGQELWRHHLAGGFSEEAYHSPGWQARLSWIGDLDGNGGAEVLFAFTPEKQIEQRPSLLCFEQSGRVRWEYAPNRVVRDEGGRTMYPPYNLGGGMVVIAGQKPGETRIAAAFVHYFNQPGLIVFLDSRGKVTGEYWHPGHLLYLAQADIDGDGRNELLAGGVNNGEHAATLVALDPVRTTGITTPVQMKDQTFRLLGMAGAREKAVVIFPRSCVSKGAAYTRLVELRVTPHRIVSVVAEDFKTTPSAITYQFDHHLNLTDAEPLKEFIDRHRELEKSGELDHQFESEKEMADLKARLVVRRY